MTAGPTALRIGDLSLDDCRRRLMDDGLAVSIGPFRLRIRVASRGVAGPLHTLYGEYPLLGAPQVLHAHVAVRDVRRWLPRPRRLVRFEVDGRAPHEDMPAGQGLPVLEWGINLVIALRYHCFLMFHAAAVERSGRGLLFPAVPGQGKTTLCVALAHRGFRLLSDEFGLLRPGSIDLVPVPRPMPLKNESIDVIRDFAPGAVLGPTIPNTRKGTLAHVRPPADAVGRMGETARLRFVVFPRWERDAPLLLEPVGRHETFMQLAGNAFNYEMLGEGAFAAVGRIVDSTRAFRLVYGRLDEAVEALRGLVDGDA